MLVVVTVIGFVASLALPAIQGARAIARRTYCVNNLRSIGQTYTRYLTFKQTDNTPLTADTFASKIAAYGGPDLSFTCPETASDSFEGVASVRVTHSGWPTQLIPMQPGPRVEKHNVTSTSYELWIEDWNNYDFNDLHLKVQPTSVSAQKVTVISVNSKSTFDILSGGGSLALSGITSSNGPNRSCTLTGEAASYGANNRLEKLSQKDSHKVMLLDYRKSVANVVGPSATDVFAVTVAPRHRLLCNVLYNSGEVLTQVPTELDPASVAAHDTLWRPYYDPKLKSGNPSDDHGDDGGGDDANRH
jgi:type II secretory pathway pseudopilin PulG